MLGGEIGSKSPVQPQRPRQHGPVVQRHLSHRDAHRGGGGQIGHELIPSLEHLHRALDDKARDFAEIVKIGRTHLQDATPLTLGQEFSGYAKQIEYGIDRVKGAMPRLLQLAQGGTGSGHRPHAKVGFAELFAGEGRGRSTGFPFVTAEKQVRGPGRPRTRSSEASGQVNVLAASCMKIANRHPAARLRPALRHRGAGPAGERARILHHAGQGQPDPVGGDDIGSGRPDHGEPTQRSPSPASIRALTS